MLITSFDTEESSPTHGGGSADVFQGVHHGCRVAIKVVRLNLSNLDEYVKVGPSVAEVVGTVLDPMAF